MKRYTNTRRPTPGINRWHK